MKNKTYKTIVVIIVVITAVICVSRWIISTVSESGLFDDVLSLFEKGEDVPEGSKWVFSGVGNLKSEKPEMAYIFGNFAIDEHVTVVQEYNEDNGGHYHTWEYVDYITFEDGIVTVHDYKGVDRGSGVDGIYTYRGYEESDFVLGKYKGNKITLVETENNWIFGYEYKNVYIKDDVLYIIAEINSISKTTATLTFDRVLE